MGWIMAESEKKKMVRVYALSSVVNIADPPAQLNAIRQNHLTAPQKELILPRRYNERQ
jgi:hypothetical protein